MVVVSLPDTEIVVCLPAAAKAGSVGLLTMFNFLLKVILFDDVSLVPSPSVLAITAVLYFPLPRIVIDTSPLKVEFVLLVGLECIWEIPLPELSVSTLIANDESASEVMVVPAPELALSFSMRMPYPLAIASVTTLFFPFQSIELLPALAFLALIKFTP